MSSNHWLTVTVGNAKSGQAIEAALQAMTTLPAHTHLALLGKGYEQYLQDIQKKGLTDRVHILPPIKPYYVVPFIRSADAALILYYAYSPNYQHCLPNGFFQSISAELPLLYPELPEIMKLAEQYNLGISINAQDPKSIHASATRLMTDRKLLEAYKRNVKVAKDELSWEKEEIILRDLIERALEQSHRS